jgi:uncharacterized protein YbjT (DUF2867 family)
MATKVILVLGATGNTGQGVLATLLTSNEFVQQKLQIRALVRDVNSSKVQVLQKSGVELVKGNFEDKDSLKAAFEGAHACYLACSNQLDQVALETNVIEAAEASSSCTYYFVKLSTCGAKSETAGSYIGHDSVIEYGRFHAAIEERLAKSDLLYTILRPNCFFQNHAGDIFGTLPQKIIAYPHETAKASLVDTRDVGAIAAKLLLLPEFEPHSGKTYDVCGPKAWSAKELAELYSKCLNDAPIQAVKCDTVSFQRGLEGAGFPEWLAVAVTANNAVFWGEGYLEYESSPEIKTLLPTFRTMEEWAKEMTPLVEFK